MGTTFHRSPLALAVLGLLEDGPLHPYGIQHRIKQWGKDQVINVGQRSTLYKMISRLAEAGLIAVHGTSRDERYPERTSYQLTEAGRAAVREWMAEMLAVPRNEFPEFPAALSFLPMLTPQQTAQYLTTRREHLAQRLAERDALLATELEGFRPPRVTMLETEYLRTVTQAEIDWIDGVLAGLRGGSLSWSREELQAFAAQLGGDGSQ